MEDFALRIRDEDHDELTTMFHGDKTLRYFYSDEQFKISKGAFGSLEYIADKSRGYFPYEQLNGEKGVCISTEIAFTGIFKPEEMKFYDFLTGNTRNKDMCDWTAGDLLFRSQRYLGTGSIALGHTHPVIVPLNIEEQIRKYGAICSKIKWDAKELKDFIVEGRKENNFLKIWLAEQQLIGRLNERYGGDYNEMRLLSQREDLISNVGIIMSPALEQIGIFEIKDKGRIIYHPWKVE